MVSYWFLQCLAGGVFGRARLCTGGWSAGRAQGPFFGVLCCIYGWLYLVRCWGFLLVWLLLYAAADCARCLQSLLLAAGSLWSLFCPHASSALCCIPFFYLDVSNAHICKASPAIQSNRNLKSAFELRPRTPRQCIITCAVPSSETGLHWFYLLYSVQGH